MDYNSYQYQSLSTHKARLISKQVKLPVSELYKHVLNQSLYFTCTRTHTITCAVINKSLIDSQQQR